MDETFTKYRQAVRRFRDRKERRAEARLVLAGLAAYTASLLLTASWGASSRDAKAVQAPSPVVAPVSVPIPVPDSMPVRVSRVTAPTPWDRNIHALPSRGKFKRFYRVTATAYRPINRGIEGGRWTVTERDGRSAHGVAVDPDIIPLGSRLWIPGYGHAVADDTGGWIKGHRIDIRCQDDDSMDIWGRRNVRVYVLEEPGGSPD